MSTPRHHRGAEARRGCCAARETGTPMTFTAAAVFCPLLMPGAAAIRGGHRRHPLVSHPMTGVGRVPCSPLGPSVREVAGVRLGGLPTAVVLNMLVVPAPFLRYGVNRPGTAGQTAPRREPEPVLEGVG